MDPEEARSFLDKVRRNGVEDARLKDQIMQTQTGA